MTTHSNDPLRNNLRESYNKFAQEREDGTVQDWKIQVRAGFLDRLQKEHKQRFLEIGAGVGRDGQFFQDQGLEVVCIDLSPAMIDFCTQKGLKAYVMDMADLQFPDASFDAVYAMNSLLHIPKAELPDVLREVDRVLAPGGLFFFGVYGGTDFEGIREQDHHDPKRLFSFFTDEHIQQVVTDVFELVSFQPVSVGEGDDFHFQALVLRKRPSAPIP